MVGTVSKKIRPDQALSAMLVDARQRRRTTFEDASHSLNIPVKQLQALEAGDFSLFSAEIYARGACLKYAHYLGLDSEASRRAIWRAVSAARQRVPLKIHTAFSLFERIMSARLVLWAGLAVVVTMIGGYIAWQVKSYWQLPSLSLLADIPAVVTQETLTIHAVAQAQARVVINGQPVILKPDATFREDMILHQGINVVVIEAHNAAGRKAVLTRHVLLPRI